MNTSLTDRACVRACMIVVTSGCGAASSSVRSSGRRRRAKSTAAQRRGGRVAAAADAATRQCSDITEQAERDSSMVQGMRRTSENERSSTAVHLLAALLAGWLAGCVGCCWRVHTGRCPLCLCLVSFAVLSFLLSLVRSFPTDHPSVRADWRTRPWLQRREGGGRRRRQ